MLDFLTLLAGAIVVLLLLALDANLKCAIAGQNVVISERGLTHFRRLVREVGLAMSAAWTGAGSRPTRPAMRKLDD